MDLTSDSFLDLEAQVLFCLLSFHAPGSVVYIRIHICTEALWRGFLPYWFPVVFPALKDLPLHREFACARTIVLSTM